MIFSPFHLFERGLFYYYFCEDKLTTSLQLNKLQKIGFIGLGITTAISLLLYTSANLSFFLFAPFYMPWMVLLLIGLSRKKNKTS